jgi:uncharacterized phage infection (PIP) family protein YhgE
MASQDDINAAVAQIQATMADVSAQVTQLGADAQAIKDAIAALPAGVDTTALNDAVTRLAGTQAALDTAVSTVTAAVPPAPAA